MVTRKFGLLIIVLIFSHLVFGQSANPGNLVIVGGGLEYNNASVFKEFIKLAGGVENAKVAVIPSASGVPVQAFEYFKNELVGYGLQPSQVTLINVALVDDDSTLNFDESSWKNNGNNPEMAAIVRKSTAVWFSGGDQLRTTKALFNPDGTRTFVLDAVWTVFENGGVVGGTSAGAAIMSNPMIGAGNSIAALKNGVITQFEGDDFPEDNGVLLTKGLGFFPYGLVDQHFSQRSRIGRLAMVLMHEKKNFKLGFGIDENTALIYYGKQNICKVAGQNGVVVINTGNSTIQTINGFNQIENLMISYMEEGDAFDLKSGVVVPDLNKNLIAGKESYKRQIIGQGGILSGSPAGFRDLITRNLMDNSVSSEVSNLTFLNNEMAFRVIFSKTSSSQGFYLSKPDGPGNYTIVNVRMDIMPVKVNISEFK